MSSIGKEPTENPAERQTREVAEAREAIVADYYEMLYTSGIPDGVLREAEAVLRMAERTEDPEELRRLRRILRALFRPRVGGE